MVLGISLPTFVMRSIVFINFIRSNKVLFYFILQPFNNLKVIDINCSEYFNKFEDFTAVPNLEKLILECCTSLSEIHPSIKVLKKLILLSLRFCIKLKRLPKEINGLASLQILDLYGCSNICQLPDDWDHLKRLRNLDIRGTGITHLPSSIFLMKNLELLSCNREEMVESAIRENIINRTIAKCFLPGSFCTFLTRLNLTNCNLTDEAFPEYLGKLVCLEYLDLSKNPFSVLPIGTSGLCKLKYLSLQYCERLKCLEPEHLPSSLEVVNVNYCTSLSSFLDPLKPCHLQCSAFCMDCTELVKKQDGSMTALASLTRFLNQVSLH